MLHVKYFQLSTVAVQIQPAGKKNCWNLFVACQILSAFHSSITDSTWGQKTGGTCLLHVKYFQLSTVAVQIQPAGKKNCWNLFVACQIFSAFHSSTTDSTCGQKTVGTCLLHVKYFQLSTVAVQIQPAGKKTVGTCLLHVKYFQLSTVALQIQPAGKKLLEPVCCMSNTFSCPQ